ncbi:hypothetical protein BHE74_00034161 [Ensete ventricosum]|nr:hypothetical protein GW17_00021072 [Ensete ventricosum]RWW58937.1 hypothetical protein BHE74_00034161 [Ensete ventricosum]RZR81128.1 hypothetical protein BHM03_00007306 [Ensete ventricosum]
MAWALKLRVLVLAYVLIPVLFHPLLSQGVMASPADSTKAKRIDGEYKHQCSFMPLVYCVFPIAYTVALLVQVKQSIKG